MADVFMPRDPLRVLETTAAVVETARLVAIDPDAIERIAGQVALFDQPPPGWTDDLHFRDGTARTAAFVLTLDALNFCFWSASADPSARWLVRRGDALLNGYWALVAALRRGIDEGFEPWSPERLALITDAETAHLLRPSEPGGVEIPLLPQRAANLRELGRGLLRFGAGEDAAARLIETAAGSAPGLAELVIAQFPSFNDVAELDGREVRFFKRAQILVADLAGAFAGQGLGRFEDLAELTIFADYKAPQVLRALGALTYRDDLAGRIEQRELLPAGTRAEIEIRSATVWACELIRRALARRGRRMAAYEIDWALWFAGQNLDADTAPYHRTATIFY